MIIDSSALLAILKGEHESNRLAEAMLMADSCIVSAPTLLETAMVIESETGERGRRDLDALVGELELRVVAFTVEQVSLAREGFRLYGKGRHPARLNFGDCMVYALAKAAGEPLLFKGGDFSKTDLAVATY